MINTRLFPIVLPILVVLLVGPAFSQVRQYQAQPYGILDLTEEQLTAIQEQRLAFQKEILTLRTELMTGYMELDNLYLQALGKIAEIIRNDDIRKRLTRCEDFESLTAVLEETAS